MDQWALVVQVFVGGCLLFPMLIALTSWIVFWEHRSRDFAGGAVTLIAGNQATNATSLSSCSVFLSPVTLTHTYSH